MDTWKNTRGTCLEVKKDGSFCYDIQITDTFAGLSAPEIGGRLLEGKRACIVTDSTVAPLYKEQVLRELKKICSKVTLFVFSAGEASKTLDVVRQLYEHLILEQFDRKDVLVALGGGVVGDLTGFTAATYLRGIDFIQVPTTLLAQVDSSIGGKTGVDFDAYKNMVGAFHMPRLVYMNLKTLESLSRRQFASGMGEVLKHGLIKDLSYYTWLLEHMDEIEERKFDALLPMVANSCKIKRAVVEKDPTEQGERALLNFGHTVGHAVEKLKDFRLLHGECVAIGAVAASYVSWKRGWLEEEEFMEIRDMFIGFGLPVRVSGLTSRDILEATRMDKKMEAGKIKFVLLKTMGEAVVARDVTDEELLAAIDYINRDVEEASNE
ncbi:MAG: 3-dehydroquinate synthase [Lachnospiraceae bacterium]|nr:3-dehydroquinate synthase [Lachnospiraceae bacterium]